MNAACRTAADKHVHQLKPTESRCRVGGRVGKAKQTQATTHVPHTASCTPSHMQRHKKLKPPQEQQTEATAVQQRTRETPSLPTQVHAQMALNKKRTQRQQQTSKPTSNQTPWASLGPKILHAATGTEWSLKCPDVLAKRRKEGSCFVLHASRAQQWWWLGSAGCGRCDHHPGRTTSQQLTSCAVPHKCASRRRNESRARDLRRTAVTDGRKHQR